MPTLSRRRKERGNELRDEASLDVNVQRHHYTAQCTQCLASVPRPVSAHTGLDPMKPTGRKTEEPAKQKQAQTWQTCVKEGTAKQNKTIQRTLEGFLHPIYKNRLLP